MRRCGGGRVRGGGGALTLALVLSLALGAFAGGAGAATTECAWQRHAKRVVTHVKRHGKSRRVVRIHHYWTCNPVMAPEITIPPQLQPPSAPTAPPAPAPGPTTEPKANAVAVIADDENANGIFSYTVLSEEPHSGPLTVQLQNQGEDPHNLNIQALGTGEPEGKPIASIEDTAPGEDATTVVDLPAGEYLLYCSIGQHAQHGMKAKLVVK